MTSPTARPRTQPAADSTALSHPRTALLALAPSLSFADRFGYLPVATTLGDHTAAAASVTSYLVAYGLSQPLWGLASDRWGRKRALRTGLSVLLASSTLAVVAPSPAWLIALRAVAGAASGALLPTTLALVGDVWAPSHRHAVISRLTATALLSAAIATVGGGALASAFGWRSAFIVLTAAAAVGALATSALPAPKHPGSGTGLRAAWASITKGGRRAVGFYAFAFVEGLVMLGSFPLIAPLVRAAGGSALAAGTTTASYGVAAVVGAAAVRRFDGHPRAVVAGGGMLLVAGTAMVGLVPTRPTAGAVAAAAALGAAFSLFHGRFQAMATQLAPAARGLGTGLFVGMVFTGAAFGTAAGTTLVARHGVGPLTLATTGIAAVVAVVGHRLATRPAH